MNPLTFPNPYQVLEVDSDAHQATITNAFVRRNRGTNRQTQMIRAAYDVLRSPKKRLLADIFTPNLGDRIADENLLEAFCTNLKDELNWLQYLDEGTILKEDFRALVEATIRHTFTDLPEPAAPQWSDHFDGLDSFLNNWLP